MIRYSVQPRDRLFVKSYGFLPFARNMGKNVGKNLSNNLSNKNCQKFLDNAKRFAKDALKTPSKRVIQNRSNQ